MALSDAGALLVGLFLVLFVMPMVGVDQVVKFANFAFEMIEAFFNFVEMGIWGLSGELAVVMAGQVRWRGKHLSFWREGLGTGQDA